MVIQQIKMLTQSNFQAIFHQLKNPFFSLFNLHFFSALFQRMMETTEMFLFTIIMQFRYFRDFLQ